MKLLVTTQAVDKNHPILAFFHGWILEFAKHFDEVHVICLQKGEYDFPKHVHVYSLGKEEGESKLKYTWRFYKYFWQLYVKNHVDFVFFHMGAIYNIMASPFFLIRKLRKTKFYWWKAHGHINWFGRLALSFVDRVHTASYDSFPINTEKKNVVGHAIDVDQFIKGDTQREGIVFVGRVTPVKRVEEALGLLAELKNRGKILSLRIVGVMPDDGYIKMIKKYTKEHSIQNQVTFVGAMTHSEVVSEYNKALISVNFSNTDSIDKVVLEAMASGAIPVTSTKAFEHLLAPFGLFVSKNNKIESANVAEKILGMKDGALEKLRIELRNIVTDKHSLSTLSQRIFNI